MGRSHREFVYLDLGDPAREMVSTGSGNPAAPTRRAQAEGWFFRHYSPVYYMPGWRTQWRWFLASLLGVFAPALLLAVAVSRDMPRRRVAFHITAFPLSLWGTWGLSDALGWFVFTWPAGVFLSLLLTLEVRAWAGQRPERPAQAAAWVALAALVAALSGYWWLCRSVFLVVGHSISPGCCRQSPWQRGPWGWPGAEPPR